MKCIRKACVSFHCSKICSGEVSALTCPGYNRPAHHEETRFQLLLLYSVLTHTGEGELLSPLHHAGPAWQHSRSLPNHSVVHMVVTLAGTDDISVRRSEPGISSVTDSCSAGQGTA
jgi:hypothetical protein